MVPLSALPTTDTCIGIIANPVSARDIRRIVANAGNLQISRPREHRAARAQRGGAPAACARVLLMPDRGGIRALLDAHLEREGNGTHALSPRSSISTWTRPRRSTTPSSRHA